jgi:hypothetical protein
MAANTATATFSRGGRGGGFNGGFRNQGGRQGGQQNPDQMVITGESQPPQNRGHRRQNHKPPTTPSTSADELTQHMKAMLDRRYNPQAKLLDLSAWEDDPEFANSGVFNKGSTRAKFFPALMKVCDIIPKDMVTGVILSNNKLKDLSSVSALPETFPDLKNLDLSNNQLINLDGLWDWRRKLLSLEHLIISGNPLETHMKGGYQEKVKRWYQQLRILNTTEVRPPQPMQAAAPDATPQTAPQAAPQAPAAGQAQGLIIPDGFGMEAPGKSAEQVQKERMALEVSKATNMTLQYSGMCLEQSNWDMKEAEKVYIAAKPTLPPEAFFST